MRKSINYIRVSSVGQNTARQEKSNKFKNIVDICSGSVPFFERDGGKVIQEMAERDELLEVHTSSVDRLGRNIGDILNTIDYFTKKNIPIHFKSPGLTTLNEDGAENPVSKLIISIMGSLAEMERNLIRERQMEGIALAKMEGKYKGRAKNTAEDTITF